MSTSRSNEISSTAVSAGFVNSAPPSARDFDFLYGRWSVAHRKLARRLADCRDWIEFSGTLEVGPILSGQGNFDVNRLADPSGSYEAHSLRLFDPATGSWSIWWIDGRRPAQLDPPVIGGFADGFGRFFADDRFDGRPIRVRTTYHMLGPGRATWTQAFAPAATSECEVNWTMDFTRTALGEE